MDDEVSTKKHSSKHRSKEEKHERHEKHKKHRDDPDRKHKKRRKHEDDGEEEGSHRKHKHRKKDGEKRRDKGGESRMEIVDDNPSDDNLWVEKDIDMGGERVSHETGVRIVRIDIFVLRYRFLHPISLLPKVSS